jgi:hypothetical protein
MNLTICLVARSTLSALALAKATLALAGCGESADGGSWRASRRRDMIAANRRRTMARTPNVGARLMGGSR